MKIRYKLSLLLIGLMLIGCLYITQSYALWIVEKEQTKENEIEVGCFSIGFSEQSESINLNNTYPMSDSLGLSSDPYTFTITNTCTINNSYVLTLNTLSTNTLDTSKIKYALYKSSEEKPTVGSKLSRINNDLENLRVENLGTSYILDTGVLTGGTKVDGEVSNGEEVTYNLYLWIDEIAGNEVEGQTFEASINVISAATESNEIGEVFGSEVANCGQSGKDAVTCIKENAYLDTINLAYDNASASGVLDNNLRYIGSDPNNYIDIGDRTSDGKVIPWRIIGVMNNITEVSNDEEKTTTIGNHLKVIRADSIGTYSWDGSQKAINNGNGVNEWSQARIMKLLNPGYDENQDIDSDEQLITVNNSLYWSNTKGNCYNNDNNAYIPCDFTSEGISDTAKNNLSKIRWNTGSFATRNDIEWTASGSYAAERSQYHGKSQCEGNGSPACNDEVPRTTTWDGYVGLMYPSDFGYAVGDNVRTNCISKSMYLYNIGNCIVSNWLHNNHDQWTITPITGPTQAEGTFRILQNGSLVPDRLSRGSTINPVVYLKSNVKIINGNGTIDNPFVLEA